MNKLLIFLLLASIALSCGKESPEHVERAFYYWKSRDWQSDEDFKKADSLGVKKMYIRFFDVDFKEGFGGFPIAKSDIRIYTHDSLAISEIVPTVYLKNENFLETDKGDLDKLADNVNFLIDKYCKERFEQFTSVKEFQMDCDWTPKSKDNYFYFLKKLKQLSGKRISCTLRLYPYKYRTKMGIPPVDRVMLMCYNLFDPLSQKDGNSILSNGELALYLTPNEPYPLRMNVALPVFSWIHVYRNNHFREVVNANLADFSGFSRKVEGMWYEVTKDSVIRNHAFSSVYLRVGDRIKYESVTSADLRRTQELLLEKAHLGDSVTVSLYHLDIHQLKKFKQDEIENFYAGFMAR